MGHLDDAVFCADSPTAILAQTKALCGNGLPQPGWPRCRNRAAWKVTGYEHEYCSTHAAARIRATNRLDRMELEARAARAQPKGGQRVA